MTVGILNLMPPREPRELELQGFFFFVYPALKGDCWSSRGAQCVAGCQGRDNS